MPWDELNTYDQCYSTTKNWSYSESTETGLPDHRISHSSGITAQFSTSLAGAIASLKILDKEYMLSGGHGAAFQYAVRPTVPDSSYCPSGEPSCVFSECFNPTEAGTKQDDYRDSMGFLHPTLKAQMHGPSTSAIWQDSTYWQSGPRSSPIQHEYFRSWNRLAYYVPEGWTGHGSCVPDYPDTSPHSFGLSHYILDKEVRLGPVRSGGYTLAAAYPGGFPVLSFNTDLMIEPGAQTNPELNTVLKAYLHEEFENFYRHRLSCPAGTQNCNCDGAVCLENITAKVVADGDSSCPQTDPSCGHEPMIVDNGDGYAIGVFAVSATTVSGSGQHELPWYWSEGTFSGNPQRSLQVDYWSDDVTPGTVNYKSYWVVGSLAWVKYVMYELRTHPNITYYSKGIAPWFIGSGEH